MNTLSGSISASFEVLTLGLMFGNGSGTEFHVPGSVNRVFHKLSTIQECHFSFAIANWKGTGQMKSATVNISIVVLSYELTEQQQQQF